MTVGWTLDKGTPGGAKWTGATSHGGRGGGVVDAGLPIIYVRGFAGRTSGIDAAVDDPFYGFNLGSVHVRVGGSGQPLFHQFESPLLRLMLDHDYALEVHGGQRAWLAEQADDSVEARSIWVHRFYDVSASTWGDDPERFELEAAAEDLLELITLVRARTGAPRVHLVAHSMGGLICRCLLQKIIPEHHTRDGGPRAAELVARLFTYATPHGGIAFDVGFGLLERLRDTFGIAGADIFGPDRMHAYLTPGDAGRRPAGWRAEDLPAEAFPHDRVFCLVGTNPEDYDVAWGLSAKAVGARSDGLVQTDRAAVTGAHTAYVHRSHSGRYGIVNSEEGYQSLRRFLFGDLAVDARLTGLDLPHGGDLVWQADVELAVRGLPVLLHQRSAAHHCPVALTRPDGSVPADVPLLSTFLLTDPADRPAEAATARYSLHLRVFALRERRGVFDFRDHLEQSADVEDLLVIDLGAREGVLAAWAVWNSELAAPLRDYTPSGAPLTHEPADDGSWSVSVPLPAAAREITGAAAAIHLAITDRSHHSAEALTRPGLR